MSSFASDIGQHAASVFGSGGGKRPGSLTDVFPSTRTIHTSLVRIPVPNQSAWNSTDPAGDFAKRKARGEVLWYPLAWIEPGNQFPDEALLYGATVRLGPCDYTGAGPAGPSFANGVKPWGTADGLGAAVVLAKTFTGARPGTTDTTPVIAQPFIAPARLDGLSELSNIAQQPVGQLRNQLSNGGAKIIDWFRPPPVAAGGVPWPTEYQRVYSPGGVRLRPNEGFGAYLLLDLHTVDIAVSANTGKCFFGLWDIAIRVLLTGAANEAEQ
jgi:murein DD-endopeptidase MepM/ murein hydrolase activator NlpD